jgi:hypothetical protein
MRVLLLTVFLSFSVWSNHSFLLESSKSCLGSIQENIYTPIDEKFYLSSSNKVMWLRKDILVYQGEERATIFPLKLRRGLNLVSLANNKGRELETVCIQKEKKSQYIYSVGADCIGMTKGNFTQTISYADMNYESNDLISNKIFNHLNELRVSFKSNVNRKKCDEYIQTYQSCLSNFSQLAGKNSIPKTETRYEFVLREIRKTLVSQCRKA